MTALDRTLIKAFHQPASRPGTAGAEPAAEAPRRAARHAVPLSQALAELAVAPTIPTEFPSTPEIGGAEAGELQPAPVEATAAPVGPSITALLDQAIHATRETEAIAVPVGPSITAPADLQLPATFDTEPTASARPTLANSAARTTAEESDKSEWRPLLQVDRVFWPSIDNRLQTTAAAAIGQMADGLLSLCASGSKVLGLASCASGEGVTTLLLAAARKLVSQGRKVVLVDANWDNPQLAQNLGLLPQIGWEETLSGGLPLEEVVIESLADGLAVLPVREPSASAITQGQIAASFETLARAFDVVLVDLGPLALLAAEAYGTHGMAAAMDALILVQNVRLTTPNRLAEVRGRLAASNLRYAGTIQNFVAG